MHLAGLRFLLIGVAWVALLLAGVYGYAVIRSPSNVQFSSSQSVTLNGGGATLAYPLLSSVIAKYEQSHPGVSINYQPFGSGAGINQFTLKTIDFGATYPPMTTQQKLRAPSALHIPESISAVAIVYSIPGVPQGLNLTRDVLSGIFLYQITNWSDPQIRNLNPSVSLPDKTIVTIHADDAGSTFVFTGFLDLNATWHGQVGQSTTPQWPGFGLGVPADADVARLIRTTPNAISYMELSYALQSQLTYASIQNDAGNFVTPSFETTKAAVDLLRMQLPDGKGDWSFVNLLDEPGRNAYSLVTFTYLLVYRDLSILPLMDIAKSKVLVDFLWFLIHDGQAQGPALDYVPLPQNIVAIDEQSIRSITFQNQPLPS